MRICVVGAGAIGGVIAARLAATGDTDVSVLARGATLAEGPYAEVSKNPAVIEAYMGTSQAELAGAH